MSALWSLANVSLGSRLRDVTLTISPGVTAVLGASGAGKTSLLNLLVGFEHPTAGALTANAARLFWAPPDDGLWPHLTALEHLRVARPSAGRELLAEFDLADKAECRPATLSRGERSRLAVARALAAEAEALVMDEPLSHVAPAHAGRYWDAVRRRLAESGASLVFATHAPATVLAEAQRVVCLQDGRVIYGGEVEPLYARPATAELAECFGEANWLTPDEARLWLEREEPAPRCYRPEQIAATPAPQGVIVVESSRFQGAVAEVEVRHETAGATRRFWHRPSADHLAKGTRVLLKALLALALCLGGCKPADAPGIAVRETRVWPVPPVGATLPAARSVTFGADGRLFALDTAGRVLVFGADGALQRQWSMPETAVGKPEGVWVLRDGHVVVCDTHYHRVIEFDAQGAVARMFGKEGRGPGEFIYPVAVVADAQENLFIAEYGSNDRLQKFSRDGRWLLSFGGFGTKPGEFQRPSGLVWHEGKIYVADAFNNRIQVFSDAGRYERTLGPLTLHFPYDLRLGADGALCVVEYGAARVSKISLDGRLLARYGGPGSGAGQFATPWGLAVDARRIVVADAGNRRLVELVTTP